MGSETILKLPVVDFNSLNLESKNPKWDEVKSQVHKALEECGCFEALFDKVPLEIRKSLIDVLKELFDLPLQAKLRNVSKKPFHGYVGQYPHVPLYESMGIDDANVLEKVKSLENNLWPEGYPSFSKTIQAFSDELSELDQIVRKMVLESLGVEKYLDEHMNSTNYLLRVMKYSAPQTEDTKLGIASHTDKNIVTILYQNEVVGLEVETKDGKWITYQPSSPHSFVVMIGDSFRAWTNGRLYSAFHRVMMTGNEARYSAGLFSIPKGGYMVKAPEELVDEEHPLMFKPFDHVEFLKYYYTEEAQRQKFALKAYCGV
ncbi:probable 2-oxoglutarate-dependent dioxygenase AOP1 [Neltuma alba]|uniref:probable 2-oxoglutarate-dependent dioxygenase AOP1 n=1 Tax=Neltuma alba TaxID=207710 RepID=UPI0010A2CC11|nr:probable 2-oxoglutarate-dependent dioxygenase AOP1 [Prosopis alba]XP_028795896.1 probable 2-oxoglutarate-dependent dioxygenase AOP1 [Prosopis alba]